MIAGTTGDREHENGKRDSQNEFHGRKRGSRKGVVPNGTMSIFVGIGRPGECRTISLGGSRRRRRRQVHFFLCGNWGRRSVGRSHAARGGRDWQQRGLLIPSGGRRNQHAWSRRGLRTDWQLRLLEGNRHEIVFFHAHLGLLAKLGEFRRGWTG